jgi:hypothetical protein
MRGIAFAQAPSADGRFLYTLYKKPNGESFVHVLDLVSQSANCIDLPEGFGTKPEAMAITAGEGGNVMVVDGAIRKIAYVNPIALKVAHATSYTKLPRTSKHIAAALAVSDAYISSGNKVMGIDTFHPGTNPRWTFDSRVQAIYQSDEDGLLYVATRHRLVAIRIGRVKPVFDIELDGIRTIGDASAATAKGSVSCAC